MGTPTLKSNTRDQKVCKKKNLSWLFGADRKIRPLGSLFGIALTAYPHSHPCDDIKTKFQVNETSIYIYRDHACEKFKATVPSDGFFYPHLTPMKDPYNILKQSEISGHLLYLYILKQSEISGGVADTRYILHIHICSIRARKMSKLKMRKK